MEAIAIELADTIKVNPLSTIVEQEATVRKCVIQKLNNMNCWKVSPAKKLLSRTKSSTKLVSYIGITRAEDTAIDTIVQKIMSIITGEANSLARSIVEDDIRRCKRLSRASYVGRCGTVCENCDNVSVGITDHCYFCGHVYNIDANVIQM